MGFLIWFAIVFCSVLLLSIVVEFICYMVLIAAETLCKVIVELVLIPSRAIALLKGAK
jgi:hypothetical protein